MLQGRRHRPEAEQQVPLDTPFIDENGRDVTLGDYFGKRPVVLALVYYECPMLCTQVLNGLVGSLEALTFNAGKEFDVVVVSFDAGRDAGDGRREARRSTCSGTAGRAPRPACIS